MNRAARKLSRPVRAVVLAILVHVAVGALLGLSLRFQPKTVQPGVAKPVQAIVIDRSAIEAQKKHEEEKNRKAEEKKRKQAEAKRKMEVEKKRKAREKKKREEAERRAAEEARHRDEQEAYSALRALVGEIKGKIEDNWSNRMACGGQEVTISVKVALSGEVESVQVLGGIADDACRRSAEYAVWKASPLPFPDNPRYYKWLDTEIQFIFRP